MLEASIQRRHPQGVKVHIQVCILGGYKCVCVCVRVCVWRGKFVSMSVYVCVRVRV